jgi:hypothetical protein
MSVGVFIQVEPFEVKCHYFFKKSVSEGSINHEQNAHGHVAVDEVKLTIMTVACLLKPID